MTVKLENWSFVSNDWQRYRRDPDMWEFEAPIPGMCLHGKVTGRRVFRRCRMIQKGRQYLNKKTGNRYEVSGFATHSETLECLVNYHAAHGLMKSKVWARPYPLFLEKFTELDGSSIPPMEDYATGLEEDEPIESLEDMQ